MDTPFNMVYNFYELIEMTTNTWLFAPLN